MGAAHQRGDAANLVAVLPLLGEHRPARLCLELVVELLGVDDRPSRERAYPLLPQEGVTGGRGDRRQQCLPERGGVGALVEADHEVLEVGRQRTLDAVGDHDPTIHDLGEGGGVAGDLGEVPEHLVDVRRPLHRGQEVPEAAGDLEPEDVHAIWPAYDVALVAQGAQEVVRRRQGDAATVGDLLGAQATGAVAERVEDAERAGNALDQVTGLPLHHQDQSPPSRSSVWKETGRVPPTRRPSERGQPPPTSG